VFGSAQHSNEVNPFELRYRMDNPPTPPLETRISDNPFDIIPYDKYKANPGLAKKPSIIKEVAIKEKPKAIKLFWLFMILLGLLTIAITLFSKFLTSIYRAFLNDNILKLLQREQKGILDFPYLFFLFFFFFNAGIFAYQAIQYFLVGKIAPGFLTVFIFVGLVAFAVISKQFFLGLIAFIFPFDKELNQYSFTITIFSIILGLVLFPINLLVSFAPQGIAVGAIFAGLVIIGLVYIFRSFRGLFLAANYLAFHKFHFFIYLCTVEIAPALIFIKILINEAAG
jgi:hypothetical protein